MNVEAIVRNWFTASPLQSGLTKRPQPNELPTFTQFQTH